MRDMGGAPLTVVICLAPLSTFRYSIIIIMVFLKTDIGFGVSLGGLGPWEGKGVGASQWRLR